MRSIAFAVGVCLALAAAVPAEAAEPGEVTLTIYNVAPGKHVAFLKWQAAREALAKEAGVPPTQWFAHLDGASWDYVSISPETTPEQDQKVDALAKQKGLTVGMPAGIELRQLLASHSDTVALGPVTITELAALAEGK